MDSALKHSHRHSSFIIHRSSFRGGVSLLEVLVSIFVIMFGLLGVAAVLPLGTRNAAEIVRSDNAAACGASALRDIRAWQLLNPNSWRWPDFSAADPKAATPTYATLSAVLGGGGNLPFGRSFALDPLFIARAAQTIGAPGANATDPQPAFFPYDPSTPSRTYWSTNALRIYRITLPLQPATLSWPQHEAFYDRFFRWQDDVTVPQPTEGTERPRQMFLCTDSVGRVLPKLPTDPATNPLPWLAQNQGDYTWMAIVTPCINEADVLWDSSGNPSDASVPAARRLQYLVQIVVFYKRDFDVPANYLTADQAPPERTVTANILSGGYGGGDVSLTTRVADGDYSHYLTVRKNQWIMLCGQAVFRNPSDATKYATSNVYRWYRVVSATDPPVSDGTNYVRYVTLAGPDWSTDATAGWCYRGGNPAGAYVDLDGDGNALDAAAVIADGVVGVYTMTFEVDRDTQTVILGP